MGQTVGPERNSVLFRSEKCPKTAKKASSQQRFCHFLAFLPLFDVFLPLFVVLLKFWFSVSESRRKCVVFDWKTTKWFVNFALFPQRDGHLEATFRRALRDSGNHENHGFD